ncbi:hypothetical protein C8T65DRAFT_816901 [Cerioporus squamosus]|nr:hypothetical protein C8T65DRAFT_816901 [Cerioporus squamosus]
MTFSSTPGQQCQYFQQGRCNRGTACKFSHSLGQQPEVPPSRLPVAPNPSGRVQVGSTQATAPPACQFYLQGACRFGDGCHYLHPRTPRTPIVPRPPSASVLQPLAPAFTPVESVFLRGSAGAFGSCKFYAQGKCSKGSACPFPHPAPKQSPNSPFRRSQRVNLSTTDCDRTKFSDTSSASSYGACKFYLQGRCTKGDTCSFWHPPVKPSTPAVSNSVIESAQSVRTSRDLKPERRPGDEILASESPIQAQDEGEITDTDETATVTLTKLNSKITYGPGAHVQTIITAFESHSVVLHNVPTVVTHAQLIALAEPYGDLKSVLILPARDDQSRPSARVEYLDTAHATRAALELGRADGLRGATSRLDLRAAESGRAILRSTKAKLTWFAPSLTAWAHYPTLSKANVQATRLDGLSFNGTTLRVAFQMPSRNQISSFSVELKGLPLDVSSIHLKRFCRASSVTLGRPSFIVKDSLRELRQLLTTFGPLESFDFLEPNKNKAKLVAFVQFSDADATQQAVATLQASRQTFLRGSQIFLELIHSIKYMLPYQQFTTLRSEIDMLRDMTEACRLRYYDKDANGRAVEKVCLRAYGADAKALGRLKTELEQLLEGDLVHDAMSQVAWHEHFSTADGLRLLEDEVAAQTGTYVKCDPRMRTLHIFGSHRARTAAKARILALLERIHAQEHVLELDIEAFTRMLRGGFQELQDALGDTVQLDVISRRLVVRGDETASRIAREAVTKGPGARKSVDVPQLSDDASCPVCFCDITDPSVLPCSHAYCRSCLQHYLGSLAQPTQGAAQTAAACLAELRQEDGSSRACGYGIPLETIRSLLTPGEEAHLLEATFLSHIHSRAQVFRYCPTADCQTIYRASTDGTLLRCPSCLARVCSTCHVEFHEGLTCAEFKDNRSGGEDSFRRWREERGVKACPGCGAGLEKNGGCNHMKCAHCGTHMCWVCMKTFRDTDSGGGVYAHMRREHGGFGT